FQRQDLPQQRLFGQAELLHVRTARRAAQRRQQRDKQNLHQIVAGIVRPRVGKIRKAFVESIHRCPLNKETPSESCSRQSASLPQVPYAIPLPSNGGESMWRLYPLAIVGVSAAAPSPSSTTSPRGPAGASFASPWRRRPGRPAAD